MRRSTLPAFVQLGNVRQTEPGERLDSLYPTLSVYVPQSSADGRQMLNSIAKFGNATYVKPPGAEPAHNLLADHHLLCTGKFFNEAKWVNSKEYRTWQNCKTAHLAALSGTCSTASTPT